MVKKYYKLFNILKQRTSYIKYRKYSKTVPLMLKIHSVLKNFIKTKSKHLCLH